MSSSSQTIVVRVQSAEGVKRVEISAKADLKQFYLNVRTAFNSKNILLYRNRNFTEEIVEDANQIVGRCFKHGDMLYLKYLDEAADHLSVDKLENAATSVNQSNGSHTQTAVTTEDAVDNLLAKSDGLINRQRDVKLCRHAGNSSCIHCSPIEPYDENYLKEHNIKHLSFYSYIRKQQSGIDRGKYVGFDDINCRIKPGCREHPPWPKGICSKCQPSAITLNRQIYRHVDNVMFENTSIVERFLNYWRITGHQRLGWLYGTYELHTDVPLGVRARVAAIYEPPQESTKDSIKLLNDDWIEHVDSAAKAMGLKKVGWIFTDLITEDSAAGTVKHIRGIETHFLTAKECIMAGYLQNCHPNPCKYASNGVFGSKFVTVCVTGDKTKQVHMEGYAVSAQCMALVRDNCLIPTKDAPEMGYVRESTEKQYVPDVFYKEKDQYGNEVQRLARPLPVEYLLVDVPASTPLQPQYTFTQFDKRTMFPVENRYLDGHLQDFNTLSMYLSQWPATEFLDAVSDFHLLVYLYKLDVLPMRQNMDLLFEAVRTKNVSKALEFKKQEVWTLLESLIKAESSGRRTYPEDGTQSLTATGAAEENAESNIWTCEHCTFINRWDHTSCEMCSLPR